MATVKMIRVDYRMVHGQIVAKWIKFRPVDRLILADDLLVDDPFMGDIYKMAVPQKEVDIVRLEDLNHAIDRKEDSVMVIFRDVASVQRALEHGFSLSELNVGAVQNSATRKAVVQGVSLSEEEFAQLEAMQHAGVHIFLQPIPENDAVEFDSIRKKFQ